MLKFQAVSEKLATKPWAILFNSPCVLYGTYFPAIEGVRLDSLGFRADNDGSTPLHA